MFFAAQGLLCVGVHANNADFVLVQSSGSAVLSFSSFFNLFLLRRVCVFVCVLMNVC